MSGDWQPIETAPKDGTVIQVRQGEYSSHHARWRYGVWTPIEYFSSYRPTHWRPLAPSPNPPL